MTPSSCYEFIESFAKAGSVEEIHTVCCAICEEFGFDHFLYATSIPTSFVTPHICIISGYPKEWRDRYNELGYTRIDPTITHCARKVTPLIWDALAHLEKSDKSVERFMGESRDFHLKGGLSIPLHGAQGEHAMLSLASNAEQARINPQIKAALPQVNLLAAYLHESVRRVIDVVAIGPAQPQLSERERECLLWTAEGKTSWETSQILGISERTVTFHLQNAIEKLQVVNRQQAVARAVAMGLITPQIG